MVFTIDIGEDIVAPLAVAEEVAVDVVGVDLVVEAVEAQDVVLGALDGVVHHGAGLHDEGPVAGLREEQFAGGLLERALGDAVRVGVLAGQLGPTHTVSVHCQGWLGRSSLLSKVSCNLGRVVRTRKVGGHN